MNIGPWQILIIALVILVLFGRGRISEMMGDFGKGIKSFKQGLNEDAERPADPARIEQRKPGIPPVAPGAASVETVTPLQAEGNDKNA